MPQAKPASLKPRVTIAEVAAALGLTKGTVSRALNGYTDISPSTRQRVIAAARNMGYSPMANAQAIRTGRVRAIGLVVQMDHPDSYRPFLAEFLQGISRAASAEAWTLTVATAGGEAEGAAALLRLYEDRKADGFILPRTMLADSRIEMLRAGDVPFVLYGRTGDDTGCAWFDILGEQAMAAAVQRLARQGHRRIAFLNSDRRYNYAALRAEGYAAGLAEAGLAQDAGLLREGLSSRDSGSRAARELLGLEEPPTALLCATDTLAMGACHAIAALGLCPGCEVSVIGYDGIPEGNYMQPPLTTFSVDQDEAGERLARLLIERCRGAAPERLRETVRARLREGGTDGPPALAPRALAARINDLQTHK
jgi:LacI family transcriptional regulator